jgi:hypothetical protein
MASTDYRACAAEPYHSASAEFIEAALQIRALGAV